MRYFYFFSYGSNLLFERIRARVDSVEVVRTHKLDGYKLAFNKMSVDGSAKANVVPAVDNCSYGVIHRIDESQKPVIDGYEALGKGYDLRYFHTNVKEETLKVGFYISTNPKYLGEDKPYNWYRDFVLYGAVQNDFPSEYIDNIRKIDSKEDPNDVRARENQEILGKARGPKN